MAQDWFDDWLQGYNEVMQPLFADLRSSLNGLERVDHLFWRRVYIRALVATIEADIFQRKKLALAGHELEPFFTTEEMAVLKEEQYSVKSNGAIQTSTKFISLAANYRLSFTLAGRLIGTRFKLDVSGSEWDDLLRCIEIRNSITHPRSAQDLEISKEDVTRAQRVSKWCRDNGARFFREAKMTDSSVPEK